jgi:hypothetical protein
MTSATSDNLHEILTERAQQLLLPRGLSPDARDRVIQATRMLRDSPELRSQYFKGMMGAWMMLQVAVIVLMGILVAIVQAVDTGAVRGVAAIAGGLETFCIAGALSACWWYYAARRVAREAHRHGTSSLEYRRAAVRATSTGRTVPYQILLGVAVTVIVLAT